MDEREATWIVEDWVGGRGLRPRGPKWLLGFHPADPSDVERHTGRRPDRGDDVWRVDIGGRFLNAGGALVYPGGVPYPQELAGRTATISSEVWLYVLEPSTRVLGLHSWPEAVRRPVAAMPKPAYPPGLVLHPVDAKPAVDLALPEPAHPDWYCAVVVCLDATEALMVFVKDVMPEPLNEMLVYDAEGLTLRVAAGAGPDLDSVLRVHQPPYQRVRLPGVQAVGRQPGRSLGPQTWPWPAELMWARDGVFYELKGFCGLETLQEFARTI